MCKKECGNDDLFTKTVDFLSETFTNNKSDVQRNLENGLSFVFHGHNNDNALKIICCVNFALFEFGACVNWVATAGALCNIREYSTDADNKSFRNCGLSTMMFQIVFQH